MIHDRICPSFAVVYILYHGSLAKHTAKKKWSTDIPYTTCFFFSSWILGWGSRSFFWTSRISGRVSLQNLQNLRPESLVDGLNETISRTDIFWWPPFLDANKKGPKRLAKGYGCTINPTQKCGFFAPWSQLPIKWQPCWESRVSLFNREIAFFFGGVLIRVCYISPSKALGAQDDDHQALFLWCLKFKGEI